MTESHRDLINETKDVIRAFEESQFDVRITTQRRAVTVMRKAVAALETAESERQTLAAERDELVREFALLSWYFPSKDG